MHFVSQHTHSTLQFACQNIIETLSNSSQVEPDLLVVDLSSGDGNVPEYKDFSCNDPSFSITNFKAKFEIMQCELEEITEALSEMIAKPYLRTPRRIIIQTLQLCRRKRQEFLLRTCRGITEDIPDTESNVRLSTVTSKSSGGLNDINLRKMGRILKLRRLN